MQGTPYDKSQLPYAELTDVIDLSLLVGQLLLQHGADSARVETTVHLIGTGLGCDWLDIVVSPNALMVTTTSGDQFRTKIRRVTRMGVDMNVIVTISKLTHKVCRGQIDRFQLRVALEALIDQEAQYNRWVIAGMVGLACGAFSQLFGGDMIVLCVTVIASTIAMLTRQELAQRHLNMYIVVMVTAFIATLVAGFAVVLKVSDQTAIALSASVLLLVPGVPLINAAEDIIQGHTLIGMVRGIMGAMISLMIALGILLARLVLHIEGI